MHKTATIEAAACPRCQSRPRPPRLTLSYMLHRIREDVFGSERGLLPTVWHLLVAPQRVALGFVRGDDLRYYGPVGFFILSLAASLLLASTQPIFDGMVAQLVANKGLMDKAAAVAFISDWNSLVYAPLVFLLALATRYFFRDGGYNYAEHLVIAAYGWSQFLLLGVLAMAVAAAFKAAGIRGAVLLPLLFGPVVYWFWYCHRVFAQAGPVGLLRAFISLCTAMVLFLILLILVVQLATLQGADP